MGVVVPDALLYAAGFLFLAISLPPVGFIVGSCTLWFYIDPITCRLCSKVVDIVGEACKGMTRNEQDGFLFPAFLLQGVFIPAFFAYNFWQYLSTGVLSFPLAYAYHLIRIGPYFTNFAYTYTLVHKEGHTSRLGLWNKPYSYGLSHVWNWWIGIFYGVLPASFAYGHSLNHHRYNNDEDDNVTTWDRPRDSFLNYVRYLPRWCAYHINISTIVQFAKERNWSVVMKMLFGTAYYYIVVGYFLLKHPLFAAVYLIYPCLEACLLLSAINWSWHCFLDPDTTNFYASSVTIFDGDTKTNILNEDYHVVHHQYPGAHWTQHPRLYEKHKQGYVDNQATIFRKTHAMEIFFLAILQKYDEFADRFVDLSGKLSREEKVELIKTRLRTCSWGPFMNKTK